MDTKIKSILVGGCMLGVGFSTWAMAQPEKEAMVLNARQRSIIPIAALTAQGDVERLKNALVEGLESGMTVNEIKEVLIQMYAYAGFPRSLTGLSTFMSVLEQRAGQGIKDEVGRDASVLPEGTNMLELGTAIQTEIVGSPVSGPLYEFAPAMDTFLKGHLFGDIFGRDILDFQERELATVAALASLAAEDQLRAHLNISMNVGLTADQMRDCLAVLETKVGQAEAQRTENLLNLVLENRQESGKFKSTACYMLTKFLDCHQA